MSNGNSGPIIELQDFDLLIPCHAAWVSGRMIHRLEHFMQVSWLTCAGFAREEVRLTWPTLRIACRGLLEPEIFRIQLQRLVEECESTWNSQMGTEWHAERILECNEQMGFDRRAGTAEHEVIETNCSELLFVVTDLMATLRRSFAGAIGNELFQCLCLAESVDQVIHPTPVHRFMPTPSFGQGVTLDWNTPPRTRSNVGELPQLPVRIEGLTRDYWNEIEMRWQQLRLPSHSLPDYAVCCALPAQGLIQMIERHFRAANLVRCDSPASRETDGAVNPDELPREGMETRHHLGLRLDGRLLYRESHPAPVGLERRLQIRLVQAFLERGRNTLTSEYLRDNWEELGGTEADPENGTIRGEISRLRDLFGELGVEIANIREVGWHLEAERAE